MSDDDNDADGFLFAWERIVLAAHISSTTKLVAFAMRTFADPDGSRVWPSVARLAVLCDLSYASVRRARQDLIRGGLLELVRRGNRRKGQADEYKIILADDLMDRLKWLTPSEIDVATQKVNEERQAAEAARRRAKNQGSETDPDSDQGSDDDPEQRIRAHAQPRSGVASEPPPTQGDHATTATNSVVGTEPRDACARERELSTVDFSADDAQLDAEEIRRRVDALKALDPVRFRNARFAARKALGLGHTVTTSPKHREALNREIYRAHRTEVAHRAS